jgi:hypothetical protein
VIAEPPKAKQPVKNGWSHVMKENIARNETVTPDERMVSTAVETRAQSFRSFARQLRALGQALEKFRFSAFDLELKDENYLVRGRAISNESVKFSFLRFVGELLRGTAAEPMWSCTAGQVDLRFSPEEIDGFDNRGRVRRQDPNKMPDPYSVSQILRGAGSYLDNRDVMTLIGISLKGKWVTVSYQSSEGRLEQAQQDLEYFYDYWVKMYLRRSNRRKLPPPSDPTILVRWQEVQKVHAISTSR